MRSVIVVIWILCLFLSPVCYSWEGWTDPEIASDIEGVFFDPEMDESADGSIHLVYLSNDYPGWPVERIYYTNWNGIEWSTPEILLYQPGDAIMTVQIKEDCFGTLHVIFSDTSYTYYMKNEGSGWSEPINLGWPTLTLDMDVDDNGEVYVVREYWDAGGALFYWTRDGVWEGPLGISMPGEHVKYNYNPKVLVDKDGLVRIVWGGVYDSGKTDSVFYYEYNGEEFVNPMIIDTGIVGTGIDPSFVVDSFGMIHIIYRASIYIYEGGYVTGFDYYIYYTVSDGVSYSMPITISNTEELCFLPDLSLDPFGKLHATWLRGASYRDDLLYSSWDKINWGPIQHLITTGDQSSPSILCDSEGTVHLAWDDHIQSDDYYVVGVTRKYRTEPGISVSLNRMHYTGGDHFSVSLDVSNPGEEVSADQYVVLEVYGEYFWYPRWGSDPEPVGLLLSEGYKTREEIISVDLPDSLGTGGPFHFYAALCISGTYDLVGDYSGAAFWFGE